MKILMAASCPNDPNLGVPGVMHSLAREYRDHGHEVRLRFQERPGRIAGMTFGIRLASSSDARWADVVDAHAVDAWPLCHRRRGPVVVARSHGLELVQHRLRMERVARGEMKVGPIYGLYRGRVRLAMERLSLSRSDAGLLLNQGDLDIAVSEFGADPGRLRLVRNGFPGPFLDGPLRETDAPGIACVGTWSHRKGADVVSAAVSAHLSRRPGRCLLAGTGGDPRSILESFHPEVRDRIEVVPRFDRQNLPRLLEGCQILLFPSRSEGYPLSLVEAMACGLAPVASAIPGVVDIVEHGRSGLLGRSGESEDFQSALLALSDDPSLLRDLRQGARERVRADSWKALAAEMLADYDRLRGVRT